MNAAILCPGPSLLDTFDAAKPHGLLIAVNRAAMVTQVDWWVFSDQHVWTDNAPPGTPKIFTRQSIVDSYKHWPVFQNHERLTFEEVAQTHPDTYRWRIFSATAAMVLACYLGATTINVYGSDMAGTDEYDGPPEHEVNRSDGRWRKEAAIVQSTMGHLAERGATVNRITSNGNL